MSCHEIAALRLGLMRVLGRPDEAERQHELAELGSAAEAPGPLRSLCNGTDLEGLARSFAAAAADLEAKVAAADLSDPQLPYLRTLVVLCRKVELDLARQIEALAGFYRDLEVVHDLVHETYPGG
jgi:uncharacterized protein DUF3209